MSSLVGQNIADFEDFFGASVSDVADTCKEREHECKTVDGTLCKFYYCCKQLEIEAEEASLHEKAEWEFEGLPDRGLRA